MIGNMELTVTPEVLASQASVVSRNIQQMKAYFGQMDSLVNKTSGYWIGAAGDSHRERYQKLQPDVEVIFKRLTEYVTDLQKMANVYAEAESYAVQVAEELPSDVIV